MFGNGPQPGDTRREMTRREPNIREPSVDEHEQGVVSSCLEGANIVRSVSMEISNDPRFFQDNVIDKRLAAFACLAVVSELMAQNAIDLGFPMKKDMGFSIVGICQFLSFVSLSLVFFGSMLGTYVGVAQPYHTYRLMTAGPTGFEAATMYYLDRGIVAWRHLAVKLVLFSLPVFCISLGFRMVPKFVREPEEEHQVEVPESLARVQGWFFLTLYVVVGVGLLHVHWVHEATFRLRYDSIAGRPSLTHLLSQVKFRMSRPSRDGYVMTPDV